MSLFLLCPKLVRLAVGCHLLLLLALCLPVLPANAEKLPQKITVASEYWANQSHHDGTGLYFELMKAIYEPLGIKVEFLLEPFLRAKLATINGEADVFVGTYSQDYRGNDLLLTPKHPINTERTIAILHYDSDLTWREIYQKNRADAPEHIRPYSMGWVIGYNYDLHFNVKKIHEFRLLEQGLKMVANKRMDVLIDNINDMDQAMLTMPGIEQHLKWELIGKRNVFMAFTNNPKAAQLCKIFDKKMAAMLASGELRQIYDKWGDDYAMVEFDAPNPHNRKVFCETTENPTPGDARGGEIY